MAEVVISNCRNTCSGDNFVRKWKGLTETRLLTHHEHGVQIEPNQC